MLTEMKAVVERLTSRAPAEPAHRAARMFLEEVDCELIARPRAGAPPARAHTIGDVLSVTASLRHACAATSGSTSARAGEESNANLSRVLRAARAFALGSGSLSALVGAAGVGPRDRAARGRAAMAWHGRREILACADDGGRCVSRDVSLDDDAASRDRAVEDDSEDGREATTLRHRAHGRCAAVAWRPRAGRALALGGASGTCVWTRERRGTRATSAVASETGALSPIDSAKIRALAVSGTSGEKAGYRWRLTIYNELGAHEAGPTPPPGGACAVERVAWSPDGRLLVACSRSSRVVHCWDVSAATYSPIGAGVAGVADLAFSACGGYLIAAHVGEGFTVWCMDDMSVRKWSTNGREVTAVAWGEVSGKSGRAPVALVATRGSVKLSAVHLSPRDSVSEVAAHVLPLELPDIVGSSGAGDSSDCDVADMVWDASSSRLALALRGGNRDGVVALYATRTANIVSGSLIGYFTVVDDDTGERLAASTLEMSSPRPVGSGRLCVTLAVAAETGDVALVPLSFADRSGATATL